jgi:tRNA (guanine-N7-)-methyltransferase
VGKNKLARWAELEQMSFVVQPSFEEVFGQDHLLKGRWGEDFFGNDRPIVLELGCGKGEYTVGLARRSPEKNFLGIDIKGARMWRGAVTARDEGLKNVGFLRTRIELIDSFFSEDEISEIWITFPDPQPTRRRARKRLTHPRFLEKYQRMLRKGGVIHLKTDNRSLYEYTLRVVTLNGLVVEERTADLYADHREGAAAAIQTYYEKQFLEAGKKICYLRFRPGEHAPLKDLPDEEQRLF